MAKLNELLKDLPIIGEYLRGEDSDEDKKEPILPEVHEPEPKKILHPKSIDKHRHQLKHRFSLQEHLMSPDWSKEKPPRTDAEREEKLFAKFSYAKPDSHQNATLFERRKSDEALRRDEEKKEYLQRIKTQIDKNAEEELPSVTQTRNDEVISLIPLKMRAKPTGEDETEPKEETPHSLSTMDTERDSIVERELRFEKEKGLLSPSSDEENDQITSTSSPTNPDIYGEADNLKQQRPSYEDYEKEKQSYSSRADAEDADLAAEKARYSEERPANPEQRISELQTPGYDRGKPPTSVVPKSEESEQEDDSAFMEAPEESELAEKLNTPEKPAQQRAVEAMADSGGRLEQIKEEDELIRPRFKCLSCQKKETDSLKREKLISEESIDLEEIISYMNKHKSILEELIDQEDQKRLQIALNVARDLKLLGREAVETLKKDLAHYFTIGNEKWKRACQEMEKLGPLVKDIESHKSSKNEL